MLKPIQNFNPSFIQSGFVCLNELLANITAVSFNPFVEEIHIYYINFTLPKFQT